MKMSQDSLPDDVLRLDDLQILVVVDNETDTLSSVDEGVPQICGIASDPLAGAFRKIQSGRRAEDVPVANQQSC